MIIEKLKLPSNGLLDVIKYVNVKAMSGSDLGKLYSSLTDAAVNEIIRNVTEPQIDPDTLTDEDKIAILFLTRQLTLGPTFDQHIKCPHCGGIHKFTVEHNELTTTYLEEFNNVIELTNGDKIYKRVPTTYILADVEFFKERNEITKIDNYLLYLLARTAKVVLADGTVINNERKIFDYYGNLPGGDFADITDKIDTVFGLNLVFHRECPITQNELLGVIGINADFFRKSRNTL